MRYSSQMVVTATGEPEVRVLTSDFRPSLGLDRMRGSSQLVRLVAKRDLKLRYAQTYLGPLWVVLQPLVPALLFTFVFTKVVTIKTAGIPYLLFVTTAMAPWNFFSRVIQRGGPALIAERALIARVYFPRLVTQIAVVVSSTVDLFVSLIVVALAMVQTGTMPTWRVVALPALFLWVATLALGSSAMIAALSVRRRDLVQTLPFITQAWLYVTPIAYPLTSASSLRPLLLVNPLTPIVEGFRWCFTGYTELSATGFAYGIAMAVVILGAGLLVFNRSDWDLADVL